LHCDKSEKSQPAATATGAIFAPKTLLLALIAEIVAAADIFL
jgi:hypothetical protein